MSEDIALDRKELKKTSMNGAAISIVSQMVKFGLLFLNQVLLARMLSPADFGLVAMIAPIMAFVLLFSDFGMSQATISRQTINQTQMTFLFWMNVVIASAIGVVIMLISPLVAMFYHEPRVIAITIVMGTSFIISGFYSQHMAIFTRNMEFRKIAILDVASLSIAMISGLIAAASGLQYWSLIVVHMMIYITNLIGSWVFSTWRPGKPVLPEDWRSLIGVGGNLSGFNFVNYFARNLDNILIGRVHGEVALGLYDRAYKLLLMPLTQISQPFGRIAFPLLSKTLREPELYKKAYFRVLEIIMLMTYPGVLYAIVDHDNLLRTLLGPKWVEVGGIFAILGLSSFLATVTNTSGWLFISQDRTREMRNWGVLSSAIIISSFVAGLKWGPIGVATAYVIATTFQGPMIWWAVTRKGPVTFSNLLDMFAPFALALAVDALFLAVMINAMPKGVLTVITLLPASYLIFLATLYALPQGRIVLKDLVGQAFTMFPPSLLARFRSNPVTVEDEPL